MSIHKHVVYTCDAPGCDARAERSIESGSTILRGEPIRAGWDEGLPANGWHAVVDIDADNRSGIPTTRHFCSWACVRAWADATVAAMEG